MEDHRQLILTEEAVRTITQSSNDSETLETDGDVNNEVTLYINTSNDTVIVDDGGTFVTCPGQVACIENVNSAKTVNCQTTNTEQLDNEPVNKNASDFASMLNLHQKNSSMSSQTQPNKLSIASKEMIDHSGRIPIVDALRQEIVLHERRSQDHDAIVNALKMNISLFEKRMADQEAIIKVTKQSYETQVKALQEKVQNLEEKVSELGLENETLKQILTKHSNMAGSGLKLSKTSFCTGSKNLNLKRNTYLPNTPKRFTSAQGSKESTATNFKTDQTEGQKSSNQNDLESTDLQKQGRGMRKKKKKTFDDEESAEKESDKDDGIDDGITYEVIEGGSQRGKKKLVSSEGYTYNVKRENPITQSTHWICNMRTKDYRCPASVSQTANRFRRGQFPHNHDAKPDATMAAKMRAEIKSRVQETHCLLLPAVESPSVIVNEIVNKKTTPDMWFNYTRQMTNLKRCASRMKQKVEKSKQELNLQLNVIEDGIQEEGDNKMQLLYASEEQIAVLKAMFPETPGSSPAKKKKDT